MDDDEEFFDVKQPLFREPSENDNEEDWSSFVLGGMAQVDEISLVRAYKNAADAIVEKALASSDLSYEYAYPALYLYRHVIELYLKMIVRPKKLTHGILDLAVEFEKLVRSEMKLVVPKWAMDHLRSFAEMDPSSQTFRYAEDKKGNRIMVEGEFVVSYGHMRKIMDVLTEGFEKAYFARPSKS